MQARSYPHKEKKSEKFPPIKFMQARSYPPKEKKIAKIPTKREIEP